MKFGKILALILTFVISTYADATEGKWVKGFGQGNFEFFIEQSGARLYISCPTQNSGSDSASDITVEYKGKNVKTFSISAGGNTYDSPIVADSRVGSSNFESLWKGLRQTDAVVKFGNTNIIFPKSNAKNVLDAKGPINFGCNDSFVGIEGSKAKSSQYKAEKNSNSESSNSVPGLSQSNIIRQCNSLRSAMSECAVAANVAQCIEMKMGVNDAYMAQSTYCDGSGNPNLWLTSKK